MSTTENNSGLRIGLVGCGRMGGEIERLAPGRGASIAARYSSRHPLGESPEGELDVAIEFTTPAAAIGNIERLVGWGIPVVVGTTGWLGELEHVREIVARGNGRLVYASNFSIGVNIFFRLVGQAAGLFNEHAIYDAAVHEIHHTGKADSPSGTALSIGALLLEGLERKNHLLTTPPEGRIPPDALHVSSQRLGATVGTHIVTFDSEADTVYLEHRAKNRSGFALGALLAAQWIIRQEPGLYRFEEIF